jgi:hypothetical protein
VPETSVHYPLPVDVCHLLQSIMHIHTLTQHSACHAGRDASNDCNNSGIDVNVAASKSKAPRLVDFSTSPLGHCTSLQPEGCHGRARLLMGTNSDIVIPPVLSNASSNTQVCCVCACKLLVHAVIDGLVLPCLLFHASTSFWGGLRWYS